MLRGGAEGNNKESDRVWNVFVDSNTMMMMMMIMEDDDEKNID